MTGIAFIVRELRLRPVVLNEQAPRPLPRVDQVAALVRRRPGLTMSRVAIELGVSKGTAGVHLNAAMHLRLVRSDNRGRYARWWPV